MANYHKILSILIFLIYIARASLAFGSVQESFYAKTNVNETVQFKIIFYSENREKINFFVEKDDSIFVLIQPNPLIYDPLKTEGKFSINNKIFNVSIVKVFITPFKSGNFTVKIKAVGQQKGEDIKFVQENLHVFKLEVLGTENAKKEELYIPKEEKGEEVKEVEKNNYFVTLILIFLILLISYLIYKM
ncbi:MAG: hypothetical protein ACP5F8_03490 [Candidatus Aenigmatarchaeota archaeon]